MLCLYVDDLRMGGAPDTLAQSWTLLRTDSADGTKGLLLDDPTPAERFLGSDSTIRCDPEKQRHVIVYSMKSYMIQVS